VNRGGVHALVAPSAAQVSLEHREPVIVLLPGSVRLPEPALELQKVLFCAEPDAIHHLADQRVLAAIRRGRRHKNDDGEHNSEDDKSPIHDGII